MAIALIHGQSIQRATRPHHLSRAGRQRGRGASRQLAVAVIGEVDACNAKEFAVAVCQAARESENFELDLTGVEFIAVDGIAALHAINAHLARSDASWWVLPSRAVLRVLDLCDPEHLIPRAGSNLVPVSAIA